MRTLLSRICLLVILVHMPASGQRVSQTASIPNHTIAEQAPHRPPGADHPESIAGTIEGFVYWDANATSHSPAASCTGLAITVSVGNSSGGPLTAYTPLGTLSNNFKYVGQVKTFLYGGKVKAYDVCTFGYNKVPVGPPLQVKLTVTQPTAFSPVAVPQVSIQGPITIVNGQCAMLPRIVNPTASDLTMHWGSCQNMAYDVNFAMQPSAQGATASGTAGTVLTRLPQPAGTPLLSGAPEEGMLSNRTGATAPNSKVELNPQPLPPRTAAGAGTGVLLQQTAGANASSSGGSVEKDPGPSRTPLLKNPGPAGTPSTKDPGPVQTLTNADVIRMRKSGMEDSAIVHAIQGSSKRFDLSPAGCRALKQANVNAMIVVAMGDGSVRPCPEIMGNVPAAMPGSSTELRPDAKNGAAARTVIKPLKLAPPKPLRKVTNPQLAKQNAGIIAVLEQQRMLAQREYAAMKATKGSVASTVSERNSGLATNFQGTASVQGLQPGRTQSSQGNITSLMTHETYFNSIVLTCTHDPTPRIIQVNGGQARGIFTPDAKYNLYTIVGCTFGKSDPGNSAYLFAPNGFKANLNIDFWSDNGITAHLDPSLAGVLDQDNVTLVVAPAGKQPFKKSGYQFYAARGMPGPDGSPQEVPLTYDSMPQSKIGLSNVTNFPGGIDQLPSNATSNFPSFSFQGIPVAGWVFRYAYEHQDVWTSRTADCFINDAGFDGDPCYQFFLIGYDGDNHQSPAWQLKSDSWDFSGFAPGFQISSYSLYVSTPDPKSLCGAWDDFGNKDAYLKGDWGYSLGPQNQIAVTWPVYRCEAIEAPPSGRISRTDQSAYGLAVWVLGPRCVDPWKGVPDQACMTNLRHMFGG